MLESGHNRSEEGMSANMRDNRAILWGVAGGVLSLGMCAVVVSDQWQTAPLWQVLFLVLSAMVFTAAVPWRKLNKWAKGFNDGP
jgi:hypothetical protein